MTRRVVWRSVRWTAGAGVAITAAIGALHLPAARPLLARLGVACPAGTVTAEQVQAARRPALDALRGTKAAPRRPALGLALDVTTEADAAIWAQGRGFACEATSRGLKFLRCRDVPERALRSGRASGTVSDLTMTFGADGRLIGVDALRTRLAASVAGSLHSAIAADLARDLGVPPDSAQGFVRYRFADYLASVTTLTLPSGPAVREQYLSTRPS
jgi:hypothetical protein